VIALPKIISFSDARVEAQVSLELHGNNISEASFIKTVLATEGTRGVPMFAKPVKRTSVRDVLGLLVKYDEAIDMLERQFEDGNVQSFVLKIVRDVTRDLQKELPLHSGEPRMQELGWLSVDRAERALRNASVRKVTCE